MKRLGLLTVGVALTILSAQALHAQSSVGALVERLEGGSDTRTRVQAALALGGLQDPGGRAALERALERDPRTSVRAAAASALGTLGDDRALAALERHVNDPSLTIRQRVEAALQRLQGGSVGEPNVLVELGPLKSGKTNVSSAVVRALHRASRDGLGALSGVRMLDAKGAAAGDLRVPLVKVTGSLKALETSKADGKLVCAARVEYVLQRMPGQVIAAVVSGSAKTTVGMDVLNDREALDKLRRQAVEAAVASALRRAPEALLKVATQ